MVIIQGRSQVQHLAVPYLSEYHSYPEKKVNRIDYLESLEPVEHLVTDSTNHKKEEIERLRRAIRSLPETDRALISMHLDGYENSEIADVLGITVNHVAVKLHRCKQQLANLLKQ